MVFPQFFHPVMAILFLSLLPWLRVLVCVCYLQGRTDIPLWVGWWDLERLQNYLAAHNLIGDVYFALDLYQGALICKRQPCLRSAIEMLLLGSEQTWEDGWIVLYLFLHLKCPFPSWRARRMLLCWLQLCRCESFINVWSTCMMQNSTIICTVL